MDATRLFFPSGESIVGAIEIDRNFDELIAIGIIEPIRANEESSNFRAHDGLARNATAANNALSGQSPLPVRVPTLEAVNGVAARATTLLRVEVIPMSSSPGHRRNQRALRVRGAGYGIGARGP